MAEPRLLTLLPTRVQQWLAPYEADEPLAASFRAQQLQAMLRLTPLAMAVNVFNGCFITWRLATVPPWLWAWMLALLLVAAQGAKSCCLPAARPWGWHGRQTSQARGRCWCCW
jgi:hypothetical protein